VGRWFDDHAETYYFVDWSSYTLMLLIGHVSCTLISEEGITDMT
jgi:hypothetical protein